MKRDSVLMLEDNAERVEQFTAAVRSLEPSVRLIVWRNARRMLAEIAPLLPTARLISLDHDLEPDLTNTADPGDGLEVARWLATQSPVCPVLVHTSNGVRGDAMVGELELTGWAFHRVMPLGDDWIEVDWCRAVRRILRRNKSARGGGPVA